MTHTVRNLVQIQTDGSKLDRAVGSGIFSEPDRIAQSIRLSDHCSILQVEAVGIQAATRIIVDGRASMREDTILSVSQAAIRALNCNMMN